MLLRREFKDWYRTASEEVRNNIVEVATVAILMQTCRTKVGTTANMFTHIRELITYTERTDEAGVWDIEHTGVVGGKLLYKRRDIVCGTSRVMQVKAFYYNRLASLAQHPGVSAPMIPSI